MINVLATALNIIPVQTITYKKWIGKTTNSLGIMVNNYDAPVNVAGNIQPADADTVYKLGIANTGDIFMCWLRGNALSIAELQSNDIIIGSDGSVFNIFKSDKWSCYPAQDWNRIFLRRAKDYE